MTINNANTNKKENNTCKGITSKEKQSSNKAKVDKTKVDKTDVINETNDVKETIESLTLSVDNGLLHWEQYGKWLGMETACAYDKYSIYYLVDLTDLQDDDEYECGTSIAETRGGGTQNSLIITLI